MYTPEQVLGPEALTDDDWLYLWCAMRAVNISMDSFRATEGLRLGFCNGPQAHLRMRCTQLLRSIFKKDDADRAMRVLVVSVNNELLCDCNEV